MTTEKNKSNQLSDIKRLFVALLFPFMIFLFLGIMGGLIFMTPFSKEDVPATQKFKDSMVNKISRELKDNNFNGDIKVISQIDQGQGGFNEPSRSSLVTNVEYSEIINGQKISVILAFGSGRSNESEEFSWDPGLLQDVFARNDESIQLKNEIEKTFNPNELTQSGYQIEMGSVNLVMNDFISEKIVTPTPRILDKWVNKNLQSSNPDVRAFGGWYNLPTRTAMENGVVYASIKLIIDRPVARNENSIEVRVVFENVFENWAKALNISSLPDGYYDFEIRGEKLGNNLYDLEQVLIKNGEISLITD